MAMTKAEKARMAQLEEELRIAKALRFTDEVKPDVPPPDSSQPFGTLTTGFTYNAYSRRVDVACSSFCFHGIGRIDKTTSQQSRSLYSTRLLALRAMRADLERQFARELADVDKQIEQEMEQ